MIDPNTVIGNRYRVTRLLGGGGMKMVYLAEDLRLAARPCALAEMVDSLTSSDAQRQAVAGFQREADMLAELNHEHIPRIYDRFSEQNHHYLVMEYVDGQTLEQEMRQAGGKLAPERVIDVALQALDTLEYLHQRTPPVIYRDLKPSNVMITGVGLVKLVDFGIARHFQPLSSATMIGTQGYAPPEQYRGKVETKSDLYALGATMHHTLSGRDPTTEPPFSFPPLRKLCPALNPALADLVGEALAYDVDRRIPDVGEFKRRLFAIKAGQTTTAPSTTGSINGPSEKSQLQLPLGPPTPVASPAAPTLLTEAAEVACPGCGRDIPFDSRFCSYCAADLRQVLGPGQVVSPEAETAVLPAAGPAIPNYSQPRYQPQTAPRRRTSATRRRHRRSRFLTLLLLLALAFVAMRLIVFLSGVFSALGPAGAASRPSRYADAPGPDDDSGGSETLIETARAAQLRQMLNMEGYPSVRFELHGENVALYGTVRSEADRLMIETTAFSVTGASSLEDHIQVVD